MVLLEMRNVVVTAPGVDVPSRAVWNTQGSAATTAVPIGDVSLPAPGPGEVWALPFGHFNVLHDGIRQDGCGEASPYPIEHQCSIQESQGVDLVEVGQFHAVDAMTLVYTGYWSFSYRIRAIGSTGGVSDMGFNGVVNVSCTNLSAF